MDDNVPDLVALSTKKCCFLSKNLDNCDKDPALDQERLIALVRISLRDAFFDQYGCWYMADDGRGFLGA